MQKIFYFKSLSVPYIFKVSWLFTFQKSADCLHFKSFDYLNFKSADAKKYSNMEGIYLFVKILWLRKGR